MNYFSFFTSSSTYNTPKSMVTCFPHMSCSLQLPSIIPSVTSACFWLIVAYLFVIWQPSEATMYFIFISFCRIIRRPKRCKNIPPRISRPARLLSSLQSIDDANSGLIVASNH